MSYTLGEGEYRLLELIWDHAPIPSGQLVKLCQEELGWKKSTTYTHVKRLSDKGLVRNEDTVVTALVPREQVQRQEIDRVVDRNFGGSLPGFVAAFLKGKTLSEEEAQQLKDLIDRHRG